MTEKDFKGDLDTISFYKEYGFTIIKAYDKKGVKAINDYAKNECIV